MSKTIKNNRFDSNENYQKRRPSSYIDRRKAKQELRVFISSIDDDEQVPYLYYQ
jgi:hypothetical protein